MRLTGALVLCTVLAWVEPAGAQVLYGTLTGTVEDKTHAGIPGAAVTIKDTQTGLTRTGATDATGGYLFSDLGAGLYEVKVTASGFRPFVQTHVAVQNNATMRVDVRLEVGSSTQSITVEATAAVLQTDRSDVNVDLGPRQLNDLPVGGTRNFQSLQVLVPGSTPPAPAHSLAGNPADALASTVNGTNNLINSTQVEGVSDTFASLPDIIAYVPPLETIQSVNIVTNSYNAEQGFAGGAVTNVTMKSGTNEFHGSAFEYNTDSAFQAKAFFDSPTERVPKRIWNQFGGTMGGPVVKNKLFFFGSYEGLRERQTNSNYPTVPTANQIAGDFGPYGVAIYDPQTGASNGSQRQPFPNARIPASRISPIASKLMGWMPAPNLSGYTQNYFVSSPLMFDRDNYDLKMNWNVSSATTVFGRYSQFNYSMADPHLLGQAGGAGGAGIFPGHDGGTVRSATIGGTRTLTPTLLIDGYIGYIRQVQLGHDNFYGQNIGLDVLGIPGTNGPDIRQSGFPGFTVSGYTAFGDPIASDPRFRWDNQFQYAANASWMHGRHNIRWGMQLLRQDRNLFQPQSGFGPRGGFTFAGGATALMGGAAPDQFNAMAQFLLGLPSTFGKSTQTAIPLTSRTWNDALYIQDQWRATRNLTLNLGVRWEYYPTPTRDHSGFGRYDPATNEVLLGGIGQVPYDMGVADSLHHFDPRFGVAYRLKSKTVLRAGYGISTDPFMLANNAPLFLAYPSVITQSYSGVNSFAPAGSLATGIPAAAPFNFANGHVPIPASVATSSIFDNYERGYIQSYNVTVQRELPGGVTLETGYVGTRAIRQSVGININAGQVGGGRAGQPQYQEFGRYAATTMTEPAFTDDYDSLQSKLSHRFAHGWLTTAAYTYSKAIGVQSAFFNTPSALDRDRTVAAFDRTQNLEVSNVFELPFGKGKRWASDGRLLSRLLGGWQANAIFSAYTGAPFTVTSSGASLNAPGNSQVADQVEPMVQKLGGVGGAPFYDPLAFRPVTAVRFGNSGLNTLRGPGLVNLDFGLFREFSITERVKAQIRAESFNLANTPHFANPNGSTASMVLAGGQVLSTGTFMDIHGIVGNPRELRFALRISF